MSALVGKKFVFIDGESQRSGTVVAKLAKYYYLMSFDGAPESFVADVDDFANPSPDGAWLFFDNAEQLVEWQRKQQPDNRPRLVPFR
jgi:hypothetical protein